MAGKKSENVVEPVIEEDPLTKLENRVAILECLVAKHLRMHYGGINPK